MLGRVVDEQFLIALRNRVGQRHGREQRPGIGVERMGEELVGRGQFLQFTLVDDRDPVADEPHHTQIMRDKEIGQPMLFLQSSLIS